MRNSDRIELSIDPGTWNPMDEDMVSMDPIEFHSEEESESCAAVAAESSTGSPLLTQKKSLLPSSLQLCPEG
ncbi:hypothetical protein HN51_031891 [Arachis hypogaea]